MKATASQFSRDTQKTEESSRILDQMDLINYELIDILHGLDIDFV